MTLIHYRYTQLGAIGGRKPKNGYEYYPSSYEHLFLIKFRIFSGLILFNNEISAFHILIHLVKHFTIGFVHLYCTQLFGSTFFKYKQYFLNLLSLYLFSFNSFNYPFRIIILLDRNNCLHWQ